MIIFLYGPDSYRRTSKLKELVETYRKKHREADIFSTDLEEGEENWTVARDFLAQPSMFVAVKLLVVKESGVEENEWIKALKSEVKNPKTFVLISDRDSPRKKFQFLLKEPVKFQSFQELEGDALHNFLKKEAAKGDLKFQSDAWIYFFKFISNGEAKSSLAVNELQKISLLNFRKPISLTDLRLLIDLRPNEALFNLARKFIGTGDKGEKLKFLEQMFLQKEAAAYIFNTLAYQSNGELAFRMADYDISIKSGKLEYEEILTDLAIS